MKLDCNFQRGWGGGGLRNNPFRGGLWKIFGTTQWIPDDSSVLAKFDNERFLKDNVFIIKYKNIIDHYFTVWYVSSVFDNSEMSPNFMV